MFDELQNKLSIKFNNIELLVRALTHRSFLNENKQATQSNERLEFLGDSVLSVLTSTELYNRFPQLPEGELTSLRSALVKTKTLADISRTIGLGQYLLMSKGEEKNGGKDNTSLLADTFEAVLGAIYMDQGIEASKKHLETWLFTQIESLNPGQLGDFKSNLQEKVQKDKNPSPVYKVISQSGPDHDKTFTVGAFLNDKLLASGEGKSKQEAEQEAAKLALEKIASQ